MRQCACVEDGARKNTKTRTQSDPQRSHCTTEDDWNCAEQLEAGPFTCLLTRSRDRQRDSHCHTGTRRSGATDRGAAEPRHSRSFSSLHSPLRTVTASALT